MRARASIDQAAQAVAWETLLLSTRCGARLGVPENLLTMW